MLTMNFFTDLNRTCYSSEMCNTAEFEIKKCRLLATYKTYLEECKKKLIEVNNCIRSYSNRTLLDFAIVKGSVMMLSNKKLIKYFILSLLLIYHI